MNTLLKKAITSSLVIHLLACESPNKVSAILSSEAIQFGAILFQEDHTKATFVLQLTELQPNTIYHVNLLGGSCSQLGGSFSLLGTVTTNGKGEAKTPGTLTYHDVEQIKLNQLSGDHVIIVSSDEDSFCSPLFVQ